MLTSHNPSAAKYNQKFLTQIQAHPESTSRRPTRSKLSSQAQIQYLNIA